VSQGSIERTIVDEAFGRILHLPAWGPTVGVGSFLTIEFGKKRTNSTGTVVGEFHLWVYGALWQIRDGARTIARSSDDRATMAVGALALDGATVRSFEFDPDSMFLAVEFDQCELLIQPLADPGMDEWMLYLNDGTVVTAGPERTVTRESASASIPLPSTAQVDAKTDDWVQLPGEYLSSPGRPWFVFPSAQDPLNELLASSSVRVQTVDLSTVNDLHDFFVFFRTMTAYPEWAADGWDQLWDVSAEIEAGWGEPLALVLTEAADLARRNLQLAFQIHSELDQLSDSLSRANKKLYVIFVGEPSDG
jgi:hypothetical protein